MSAVKDMLDTFSAVKNKDRGVTKQIEAVMLHARARQMLAQKRRHILFSILIGLVTRIIISVLGFLAAPYFSTCIFFLCLGAAVLAFFLSDFWGINSWMAAVSAYLISYLLSNFKSTIDFFRTTLFDLLDLLLFGTLTKFVSKVIVDGGKNGTDLLLTTENKWYLPTPIAYHFHESRHPVIANRDLRRVEEQFLNLAVERTNDELAIQECDNYWTEASEQPE